MLIINRNKLKGEHTEEEIKAVEDIAYFLLSKYPDKNPPKYFDLTPPDGDSEVIKNFLVADPICMYTPFKPWKYMRLSGKPAYRLYTWILNTWDKLFKRNK